MEDFLEVLLVGFACNLVVGVDDVKWVHQEVTICTGLQVLVDFEWRCHYVARVRVVPMKVHPSS